MTDGMVINSLGHPVGLPVLNWKRRPYPPWTTMEGRTCRLEPLKIEKHIQDLYDAFGRDKDGRNWTYLPQGPFPDFPSFQAWLNKVTTDKSRLYFAIVDKKTGRGVGIASYLNITPEHGSIGVGSVHFSPNLQRTTMATEAMYLMMRRVFDELGYRRYEWKCDILNAKSRAAAARFGFRFEGVFRQHMVRKGLNRDSAWYSIIDSEWPKIRAAFEKWLNPENFDEEGNQRQRLSDLTRRADEEGSSRKN